ncbi:MAG TPA: carboxymuconolactone decarboxylase family protein [Bryobacteraceae bacterium]|nr:carboxymuconolactone decarboxylase family protein [Bryobacteraceae bacterium]
MTTTRCPLIFVALAVIASGAVPAGAQWVLEPPGAHQPIALKVPRIVPVPESQWTDVQKQLVSKYAPNGRADNALKTLLNLPELVEAVMPYTNYLLNESSLSPRHRALLILRAAWLLGNQPLWATHAKAARDAGMSSSELRRVAQGPDESGWEPFEATLLRLADELFRNSSVTNSTWQSLSSRYDMTNLMDAVETVNHFILLSMLYNTFGVQPDTALKDRLPADVTYRIRVPAREPAVTAARVEPNAGRGIAVSRTFAKYPTLNQRWSPRQLFILRTSKLTPHQREMLILRMGWNCRSEYEWAKHVGSVGRARDQGLDPAKIAEGANASVWDPLDRALLHASDELYRDGIVSDATWRELSEELDTGLIMSAIFTTADYRAISLSLNTYGVQLDAPGDERLPQIPTR